MSRVEKHRVLYDCDNTLGLPRNEIDDGLALLYLLGRPDIEVVGLTTTFGNGAIADVHRATQALLRAVQRPDLPLYQGAGQRGPAPTPAAHFLAETVAAAPGAISIVAAGPLGNLHAAAVLDPDFFAHVKQIVCMGGYRRHPLRIGWRNLTELNLSCDPEAAHAVLHSGANVTLMDGHICLQAAFGWRDLRHVRHWGAEMTRIVRRWLLAFGAYCGVARFYLWDLLPAVYISHPDLFAPGPVRHISTVRDLETGTLVFDESGTPLNLPARIVDIARFRALLFEAWRAVKVIF